MILTRRISGQCGCGHPDTDTDNDGTADCNDSCPNDATKTAAGVCGCGTPETDSDSDGIPNCRDECPSDSRKVLSGDCGCSNAHQPQNAPCDDGMCSANTQCDNTGLCGSASQCGVPDTNCTFAMRGGSAYWICNNNRTFADARQRCQSIAGWDLALVDGGQSENDFLKGKISGHSFVGATDVGHVGDRYWLPTATQFWTGGKNGHPVSGLYTNWESGQPDDGLQNNKNCMLLDVPLVQSKWETDTCSSTHNYVCESTDQCPLDPNKTSPGTCGCGYADSDVNHDGVVECLACFDTQGSHQAPPGHWRTNVPRTAAPWDGAWSLSRRDRWTAQIGAATATPVMDADTVYVGNAAGDFLAIENNGATKWSVHVGGGIVGSAARGATGYV